MQLYGVDVAITGLLLLYIQLGRAGALGFKGIRALPEARCARCQTERKMSAEEPPIIDFSDFQERKGAILDGLMSAAVTKGECSCDWVGVRS